MVLGDRSARGSTSNSSVATACSSSWTAVATASGGPLDHPSSVALVDLERVSNDCTELGEIQGESGRFSFERQDAENGSQECALQALLVGAAALGANVAAAETIEIAAHNAWGEQVMYFGLAYLCPSMYPPNRSLQLTVYRAFESVRGRVRRYRRFAARW